MFFGLFKEKELPILRAEMLQPVDAPISTAEAKRVFKDWMLRIGFLDRQEVADHVGYFATEIKEHEQVLKEDVHYAKEERTETLKELKGLKRDLARSTDPKERKALEEDIASLEKFIDMAPNGRNPEEALARFKADKRTFLVEYINSQVHGADWKSKL